MDDIPSFSSPSPVSSPVSPSSSHFFLNHNKAHEGRGGGGQSPSSVFNNNNSLGSAAYHSRISLSSNPSPVLKPRTVVSSLSFNRGTVHNNSSSVTRAASFQSRLNPNGFSMLSGPGSDNDSLHSSTSSLEFSGGGGGSLQFTKLASYPSPPLQEYHRAQPQLPQQHQQRAANLGSNQNLKKFSSHGSVFHSELDQGPGIMLGAPEPHGINHGSMPSLDVQIRDGGVGMMGLQRVGGGGRTSPGLRYANANTTWNGRLQNASSFGEEDCCGSNNHQQQGPQVLQAPQLKAKETPRLNKFPLNLDNLVSSSTSSPSKAHTGFMNPNPPKPPPRSTGSLQHHTNSPSTSASPSASLSSLDSSSDTPPLPHHHPCLPSSPHSPTPSQGSIPVPEVSYSPLPLSPAQTPQLQILSGPQVVQVVPSPSSSSRPRAIGSPEDVPRDSVGSILQRIASFTRPAVPDAPPAAVIQPSAVQSNGLSADPDCPAGSRHGPTWRQGRKKKEGRTRRCFLNQPANLVTVGNIISHISWIDKSSLNLVICKSTLFIIGKKLFVNLPTSPLDVTCSVDVVEADDNGCDDPLVHIN